MANTKERGSEAGFAWPPTCVDRLRKRVERWIRRYDKSFTDRSEVVGEIVDILCWAQRPSVRVAPAQPKPGPVVLLPDWSTPLKLRFASRAAGPALVACAEERVDKHHAAWVRDTKDLVDLVARGPREDGQVKKLAENLFREGLRECAALLRLPQCLEALDGGLASDPDRRLHDSSIGTAIVALLKCAQELSSSDSAGDQASSVHSRLREIVALLEDWPPAQGGRDRSWPLSFRSVLKAKVLGRMEVYSGGYVDRDGLLRRVTDILWRAQDSFPRDRESPVPRINCSRSGPALVKYLEGVIDLRLSAWLDCILGLEGKLRLGLGDDVETRRLARHLYFQEGLEECWILVQFPSFGHEPGPGDPPRPMTRITEPIREAIKALRNCVWTLGTEGAKDIDWSELERRLCEIRERLGEWRVASRLPGTHQGEVSSFEDQQRAELSAILEMDTTTVARVLDQWLLFAEWVERFENGEGVIDFRESLVPARMFPRSAKAARPPGLIWAEGFRKSTECLLPVIRKAGLSTVPGQDLRICVGKVLKGKEARLEEAVDKVRGLVLEVVDQQEEGAGEQPQEVAATGEGDAMCAPVAAIPSPDAGMGVVDVPNEQSPEEELRVGYRDVLDGRDDLGLPKTAKSTYQRWCGNPAAAKDLGVICKGKVSAQRPLVAGLKRLHAQKSERRRPPQMRED